MNIVYAVKIICAFLFLIGAARVVMGPGLKAVMSASDWQVAWRGLVVTMVLITFSFRSPVYLLVLGIWAPILANMFDPAGNGRLLSYCLLLCASPPMYFQVSHIGPINDLIHLTPGRMLGLVLLIPEALRLLGRRDKPTRPFWMVFADVAVFGYAAYWVLHLYLGSPLSVIARQSLPQVLDTALPYYVFTRACVDKELRFRVMGIILFAASFMAIVGIAETLSNHYFYLQFQWLYHEDWAQGRGLVRGGLLRAQAAYLGPLALAVLLMFSLALWAMLKPTMRTRSYSLLGLVLLLGLGATFARGPWLATLVLIASLGVLRLTSGRTYLLLVVLGILALIVCWETGLVAAVIEAMRSTDPADARADFNIRYRQELLTTSLALLEQSPWWGVPNFIAYLQDLKQGEGIVDLVNTYLIVALNVGSVGLFVYLLPFVVTLWHLARRHFKGAVDGGGEGPIWMGIIVAMLAVIFTVSTVSIIQPVLLLTLSLAIAHLSQEAVGAESVVKKPHRLGLA